MATSHKIETPVEGYTGTVAGVDFVKGKGRTGDPSALAYFRRHGYTIDGKSARADGASAASSGKGPVAVGTRLRDSATNPRNGDVTRPADAGKKDPSGPDAVSPKLQAVQEPNEGVAPSGGGPDRPAGNASKDAWQTYALTQGHAAEALDGLARDDIRELFDSE